MDIIDLPNNKIKHIIIGNKKTIQPKKQSSITTKEFQDYVIQFIKEQKEFNKIVMQRLDRIEYCPTIQKELKRL